MPLDRRERDEIREKYAGQPGTGQLIEQAATEQANAGDGNQTRDEAAGKVLSGLGHVSRRDRQQAAAARREAAKAEERGGDTGDKTKPAPAQAGRTRATR